MALELHQCRHRCSVCKHSIQQQILDLLKKFCQLIGYKVTELTNNFQTNDGLTHSDFQYTLMKG